MLEYQQYTPGMRPTKRRPWSAIVLCLPGAFVVGWCGIAGAAVFGGGFDQHTSEFTQHCIYFWGVFGGACLGATPGLLVGCYQGGLRWTCPFLGAAAGALISVFSDERYLYIDYVDERDLINVPIGPALVLLGFIIGCWPYLRSFRSGQK